MQPVLPASEFVPNETIEVPKLTNHGIATAGD
ncbi:hypothetical protein SAMN05421636_102411 [Pricia antarctica]|uniref:Uncharacterized protein n=1 Tax=Pricia antarctica TaxID=641691 RepID=A0A1G6YX60_9FLAO|nr:hypothetical protein SAMN05421636_102411 [Pricia antarctica]